MPQVNKVLGQVIPAAATLTTLYTVPAATSTIVSTLVVCNQTAADAFFRIAIRPSGASIATSQYIVYNASIAAYDSVFITVGITLLATDVVSVRSADGSVSFNLFGVEIT